ncbi:MAG: thioredoxin family protein [Sphaerobacter sp.]|nr:thioredoxin family protein [Sphaerobacter sp.]
MSAAERWPQAMTIDEYIARMRENRERFLENIERTEITEFDRAVFGQQPLRILVLTEDWCRDSAQFVPVVVRLAREVPTVEVRVLPRDQHRDLNARYPRKDGYLAIPVFILMDKNLNEIGVLVERPERATREIAAETRRFAEAHPELPGINRMVDHMPDETRAAVKAHIAEWRLGQQDRFARYLLEDLAAILQRARAEQMA